MGDKATASMALVPTRLLAGRSVDDRDELLEVADRYNELKASVGVGLIPLSSYYIAQCRELHDRQVAGPTVTV